MSVGQELSAQHAALLIQDQPAPALIVLWPSKQVGRVGGEQALEGERLHGAGRSMAVLVAVG